MPVASTPLLPDADPFEIDGGNVGVLLVHGFTGCPQSMRPWGTHLGEAGLTVSCPLLPGHGTRWQDMNTTTWQDWYLAADAEFEKLRARCTSVFVMGLSMGGTLTLRLAEQHGAAVAGIVTVNASLGTDRLDAKVAPLVARLVPSTKGVANDIKAPGVTEVGYDRVPLKAFVSLRKLWEVTLADLGRITAPALAYRSRVDHVVEPTSGRLLLAGTTSTTVTEVVLENSYHVATLDNDKEQIFAGSVDFIREHAEVAG